MIIFLLITIGFWRVVLCEFETLGKVSSNVFTDKVHRKQQRGGVQCVCDWGWGEGELRWGMCKDRSDAEEASEARHRPMAWVTVCSWGG
ncbi:uncharacterized protein MONOS_18426 [Monocercomonoides exilis]|uniref:uncharacterized protein n=1 Tax=Monocercomonoides exilis TaxID=2049356 RepID=UPI003559936C|nr:hypothetical protein MONOS_18426 [Monocercomonoides exilis]